LLSNCHHDSAVIPGGSLTQPNAARARTAAKENSMKKTLHLGFALAVLLSSNAFGQGIEPGSKIYIAPNEGFDTYLTAAIAKKKVRVTVVMDKAKADFVVTSVLEHGKEPGFAQTWVLGKRQRNEDASVTVVDARTTAVVWAYSVRKYDARHGAQSTAEAVAKHLKEVMDK
jgi:hypothetical protein